MKTSPLARTARNFWLALICLAIAAIAFAEFGVGESLASRFGQASACQSEIPQAPSVGVSDLMASIR